MRQRGSGKPTALPPIKRLVIQHKTTVTPAQVKTALTLPLLEGLSSLLSENRSGGQPLNTAF
jgi:hypothetical protein